jgi:GTP pyrophosphokinase
VLLDGSENASVQLRRLLPAHARATASVGYLGRGEGLMRACRRLHRGAKLAIAPSDALRLSGPTSRSAFETGLLVTAANGKGVLAQVAGALARAEVDITHIGMGDEAGHDAADIHFVIAVRDRTHLDTALRNLRRSPPS